MESPVVPPGEPLPVSFKIPGKIGADGTTMQPLELYGGGGSETMYIELAYSDVLGAITMKAKFQFYRKIPQERNPDPWKVIETTYQKDGREPIILRGI